MKDADVIHTGRWRLGAAVATLAAGTMLLAACGGGSSSSGAEPAKGSGPYGFESEAQSKSAPITVWVDATRLAAAQAFQKANPDVKIKIVTYDGYANGSNSFKTKMSLFDQAGTGWPDVVFTTQNNDAAWVARRHRQAGLRPARQGPGPAGDAGRVHRGRAGPVHGRRQRLLPAQRPRPERALVQQDADGPVRLHRPDDLGGVPGARREGRQGAPRLHRRHRRRRLDARGLHLGEQVPGQRRHRREVGHGRHQDPNCVKAPRSCSTP